MKNFIFFYSDSSRAPCSPRSPSYFTSIAVNKQPIKEAVSFFSAAYRALLSLNAWHQAAGTERPLPVILSSVESRPPSKMLSSPGVTSLWGTLSLTLAKRGE